jgi:hypothetical protein
MSAQIIQLPEPKIRPDPALCLARVNACCGDKRLLFVLALQMLDVIEGHPRRGIADHAECRDIINNLFIAWSALGEMLGLNAK